MDNELNQLIESFDGQLILSNAISVDNINKFIKKHYSEYILNTICINHELGDNFGNYFDETTCIIDYISGIVYYKLVNSATADRMIQNDVHMMTQCELHKIKSEIP